MKEQKEIKNKKLSLNKETITVLSQNELRRVLGGYDPPATLSSTLSGNGNPNPTSGTIV